MRKKLRRHRENIPSPRFLRLLGRLRIFSMVLPGRGMLSPAWGDDTRLQRFLEILEALAHRRLFQQCFNVLFTPYFQ